MKRPLLAFGAPPDAVAWAALVLGVVTLGLAVFGRRLLHRLERVPAAWLVGALSTAAALLSAGYVAFYLRGGPRIIDATSYFLEARALAEGALAFDVPEPSGSFRGRFLVTAEDSTRLAVIFPPGYPALLAAGWLLGAPLAVGPLIAAALTVATGALAFALFQRRDLAIAAALVGVLSAALRYHTADTMSHGWAALLLTTALLGAVRGGLSGALIAGLAVGWLAATRPPTAAVALLAGGSLFVRRPREVVPFALALLPGIALLLLHQHAATGSWLASSQLRYYALADGPPGCFRYGFGSGVGCVHEHGDFVRARLESGFDTLAVLGTTLRRVWHHSLDIANFEPLSLLVVLAAVRGWRLPRVRLLTLTILGVVLAYVPYYFDATYPGGGARLYADALPLEHVLLAHALVDLGVARFAAPASLCGFALHASYGHRALAEREGGRPMFEPGLVARAGVEHGLLLVDTDHGFNLGHAPFARTSTGLVVARATGDAHERVLWELAGRPSVHRYSFAPESPSATPRIERYVIPVHPTLRFEAEHGWPALAVEGGWVQPLFPPCSSKGRALGLRAAPGRPLTVVFEVYALAEGPHEVQIGWVGRAPGSSADVVLGRTVWQDRAPINASDCWAGQARIVNLSRGLHRLSVLLSQAERAIDFVDLTPKRLISVTNP